MSHIALQHVIVRMLYDPSFVRRVYADPHVATGDCDVTDDERAWLVRSDRRAWSVDPYRRARSLTGLLEEYPVSCARLVRALGSDAAGARLDSYFSSERFHRDVQAGSTLAESFGDWLASDEATTDTDTTTTLAEHPIERGIVGARRAFERRGPEAAGEGAWVLAPGVEIAFAAEGAVASFANALGTLRGHASGLPEAVLDEGLALPDPPRSDARDGVLVLGHTGDVGLEAVSPELATVLEGCRSAVDFDALCRHAGTVGASPDDVRGIVDSFVGDGVLRRIGAAS